MNSFAFASYALYFLGGASLTVMGSVFPQLLDFYHLSYMVGGWLVFVGSIGFIMGVPVAYFLMRHLGEGTLLSLAVFFVAGAAFGLFMLPPVGWIFVCNFMSGIGVSMVEMAVATYMMEKFAGRRAIVMSYLEVSFGLGALCMPGISSLFLAFGNWRFSFLVTSGFGLLLAIVWRMIPFSGGETDTSKPLDAREGSFQITAKKMRWILLGLFSFMIFAYAGIEGSLNNFLSSVFITYLGEVPYFASLSISIFWVAMVVGRLTTSWVIRKVSYSRFLLWSIIGTLAGIIGFILLKNAVVGYLLVVWLGFMMSGIYSITMVYANHTIPGLVRLVTSFITAFAGIGGAVFPALVGATIDSKGMAASLWLVAGFAGFYTAVLLTMLAMQGKLKKDMVMTESM